jgi:endonuclease YncB( thermonuclease family)
MMRGWGGISALVVFAWVWASGCDRGVTAETPDSRLEAPRSIGENDTQEAGPRPKAKVDQEGLLIGEYALPPNPVIDGDTIRVKGIEGSVRLLKIDTEEKFRGKAERVAAQKDFEQYRDRKRRRSKGPAKFATPMGEEAAEFARGFFDGAEVVRLERDDPKAIRGRHGRLLAYAFVKKRGRWTSYNVECVRAGMSPYFTKYGYSHRFGNQLAHAEAEARSAKRGIWSPDAKGYGDYDDRKAWWDARADFIRAFEHEANRLNDHIELWHWDALTRLEQKLGEEVTLLSTIEKIEHFKGLVRVSLSSEQRKGFPVVFFDKGVFRESNIGRYGREPVTVRGKVERYEKGSYRTLQIVVDEPAQVGLPALPRNDG